MNAAITDNNNNNNNNNNNTATATTNKSNNNSNNYNNKKKVIRKIKMKIGCSLKKNQKKSFIYGGLALFQNLNYIELIICSKRSFTGGQLICFY